MSDLDKELALAALRKVNTDLIMSRQELDKLVSDLMDFADEMNEWEYDFINDMAVRVGQQNGGLSKGQIEHLKKMERKYL